MRIIIPNLHTNWMLLKTSSVFILKNSAATKHAYILHYLLDNPNIEVCNYINDRGFSLYTKGGNSFQKFLNLFSKFENNYILRKNGIPNNQITIIKDSSEIQPNDIILLHNIISTGYRGMGQINGFKVLSMIHFHGNAYENKRILDANINCIINEADLQKTSEIYRQYYHLDIPWVIHPFVFADRFKKTKDYKNRKNKCFSTGTITYKTHKEFISVYGNPCDQPMRKCVKDNPTFFDNTIDCFNYDYLEDEKGKAISPKDNPVIKLYKRFYNRIHLGKQKKYFSFDMVEKFNEYKMHLVGEEVLGIPGIGFVEGMACGSAYIGLDSPMYTDLGLIPGKHYIAYDGTKEDLRKKIEYYQKEENQEELETIALNGYEYVKNHFNGEIVAKELINRIEELQSKCCKFTNK